MAKNELSDAISKLSDTQAGAIRKILRKANSETLGILASELSEGRLTDKTIDKILKMRSSAFDEIDALILLMLLNINNVYTKKLQKLSKDKLNPTKFNPSKLVILGMPLAEWLSTYKDNDVKRIKANLRLSRIQKLDVTETIKKVKKPLGVSIRSADFVTENIAFGGAELTTTEIAKKNSKQVRFQAILDKRTSDFCLKHNANIYNVDDPNRPSLPAHPRCRSIYVIL